MRILIAMALLFAITPGLSEVVESTVHLVAHGDVAHHTDADAGDAGAGCSEHTCTPLSHHCSCHATMSAQVQKVAYLSELAGVARRCRIATAAQNGRACEPPPLRPPIC